MSEADSDYQVAVVGGGPAGLTTALYTTRLGHDTVLIDRGGGRAAMMQDTHNVIGITEETSGNELLQTAKAQIESYGADTVRGMVSDIDGSAGSFELAVGEETYTAERVVLATGFADERPDPPLPRTGRGLHYCLHCDAYMFVDESVYVMGTGESAAHVAMIMLNFTDEVDLLLRGEEPAWSEETDRQLRAHPVDVIETEIAGMNTGEDGWLESFEFEDGTVREYRGGFPMYGSDYNADLADALGLERADDGNVAVDDHGRTSVDGVSAVGDLTPGHNQIPVAMGEGAKAGIALHYDLREFPKSLDELDGEQVDPASTPAISDELREAARRRDEVEPAAADD
ncbi:NAD(P)/FAD-dependent oxidoreductase [Halolamina sediminis]|uniref:NAD(P)/FAD-dependent oxidoreductase n=1 Tax=Halolamina sediminis TaxID=1480675 RepID=UPI0006B44711|nr:NAD(P)/FAD-dependent oxidoreductase [Halolamina sediminis]